MPGLMGHSCAHLCSHMSRHLHGFTLRTSLQLQRRPTCSTKPACASRMRAHVKCAHIKRCTLQAGHEQRPGSAPELNQFNTLFDDDNWAGMLLAQVELQSEDFLLPEGFGLPGDSLALPAAPAQEPAKPRSASVYNIQAVCSTEARPMHSKTQLCMAIAAQHNQAH